MLQLLQDLQDLHNCAPLQSKTMQILHDLFMLQHFGDYPGFLDKFNKMLKNPVSQNLNIFRLVFHSSELREISMLEVSEFSKRK